MGAEWWGLIGVLFAMGLTMASGFLMIHYVLKKSNK